MEAFQNLGHSVPLADMEALNHLAKMYSGCVGVEVGSFAGVSAIVLSEHLRTLYCVDTWEGSDDPDDHLNKAFFAGLNGKAFTTFCRNMGPLLYTKVIPCRGSSLLYAEVFPRKVDFLFIDADHSFLGVKADLDAWLPNVRSGGLCCCHDYGVFYGVTQVVNEVAPHRQTAGQTLAWWRV